MRDGGRIFKTRKDNRKKPKRNRIREECEWENKARGDMGKGKCAALSQINYRFYLFFMLTRRKGFFCSQKKFYLCPRRKTRDRRKRNRTGIKKDQRRE
jgi:hypothetical protein